MLRGDEHALMYADRPEVTYATAPVTLDVSVAGKQAGRSPNRVIV
jgi:hypothetical protein